MYRKTQYHLTELCLQTHALVKLLLNVMNELSWRNFSQTLDRTHGGTKAKPAVNSAICWRSFRRAAVYDWAVDKMYIPFRHNFFHGGW